MSAIAGGQANPVVPNRDYTPLYLSMYRRHYYPNLLEQYHDDRTYAA